MQVSFQPAVKTQNQPSFGMAKLTKKGQAAAKHFVGKLPQFVVPIPSLPIRMHSSSKNRFFRSQDAQKLKASSLMST